jgi:DNA-binding CsgD family transcriptional regulator
MKGKSHAAFDFINGLVSATTAGDAAQRFGAFAKRYGFSYFVIGCIPRDLRHADVDDVWAASGTHPWAHHWIQKYLRTDPLLDELRERPHPIRWTQSRAARAGKGAKIIRDSRAFGIHDGYSSALRLDADNVVGLSLGTEWYDLSPEDENSVHLASAYYSLQLARVQWQKPVSRSTLSTRERECLRWVASGKTDWEISKILTISEKTAQEHVGRALAKLKAATRAQAVAIALLTNEIAL